MWNRTKFPKEYNYLKGEFVRILTFQVAGLSISLLTKEIIKTEINNKRR